MDPKELFSRIESQYGLPAGHLDRMWAIESARGKNMEAPTSTARGHFQFINETAKQYGLSPKDRYDLTRSSDAAGRLAANAAKSLTKAGLPVTSENLYLYHQQGPGGASRLLADPARKAIDALTLAYDGNVEKAKKAILNNGGDLDMTSGAFANKIADSYYKRAGQTRPVTTDKDTNRSIAPATTGSPIASAWRGITQHQDPLSSLPTFAKGIAAAFQNGGKRPSATSPTHPQTYTPTSDSDVPASPASAFLRKILIETFGAKQAALMQGGQE